MGEYTPKPEREPAVADTSDLVDAIATQATEPISSATGGQSATGRTTADTIQAVQHLEMRTAVRKRRRGLTFTKLIPAGPEPDGGRSLPDFGRPGGV